MLPYWFLFLYFALGGLLRIRAQATAALPLDVNGQPVAGAGTGTPLNSFMFIVGMIIVALMVGLRYEVGADWFNYENIFRYSSLAKFDTNIAQGDWGYQLLNSLVAEIGGTLWQVNLVCAAIFTWGLYRFARSQPDPWLVIVVAIPYLIIVVAMGYTRQAAALGFLMAGLSGVIRGGGLVRFAGYVAAAALFHRTAIVVLPLMSFIFPRSRATGLLLVVGLSVSLYVLFLQDSVTLFRTNYIDARYSSQGAWIRVAQLALAASIFVIARKSMRFSEVEGKIWRNFTIVSFLTVVALILTPSSTAVDRVSLYLMPLQLAVIARLPLWLTNAVIGRLAVIGYAAAVLFVWLNYAVHADYWLPYQTILFSDSGR